MAASGNGFPRSRELIGGNDLRETPRPRPLLLPAGALMAGIWLSEWVGPLTSGWRIAAFLLPPVALALLLLGFWRRARRPVLLGLLAVTAGATGLGRHQSTLERPAHHIVQALGDEPVLTRLAGRVVTPPIERPPLKPNPFLPFDPSPRTQFVLAVDELRTSAPPLPVAGNLRVSVEARGLSLQLGQRVQLTGRLWRLLGPQNPGEVDWSRWYRQQGVDAGLTVPEAAHVVVLPDPIAPWPRFATAVRQRARSLLYEPYADLETHESARLLDVMILGQRSSADRALNEAFLRAGGLHFLAVSGFNVMVLAGAVWWLTRRVLRQGERVAAALAVIATLLFAVVTEPNAPILRATIAVLLVALARVTGRPVCAVNSLALAAVAVLLWNPRELFGAAFQLTFVQVLVLIVIIPRIYRTVVARRRDEGPPPEAQTAWQLVRRTAWRWLAGLTLVCLCTWASALPLVLWHFGRFTPWGWLGTIPLTPLVTLVTLLSLATLAANAVLPMLGAGLGIALERSTEFLLWSVRLFENLPSAVVECQRPPMWLVLGTYSVLLAFVAVPKARPSAEPRPNPRRLPLVRGPTLVAANAIALLALAWTGWAVLPASRGLGYALTVLAAGNGNAMVLTTPDGSAAVLDVGTDTNSDIGETTARALRALGVRRVDAAIVSHANVDHYSGLPSLMRRMPVERWLTNPYWPSQFSPESVLPELIAQLPKDRAAPAALRAGDQHRIGDATLAVLWPPDGLDETWTVNDRSLVLRVTAAGRTILLTGDLEAAGIVALLEAERQGRISLKADVLIAPHHGQVIRDLSADFYAAVAPRVVIASTRTPRPKLESLVPEALGPTARLLLTGQVGAVTLRISPAGQLAVQTPYARTTAQ